MRCYKGFWFPNRHPLYTLSALRCHRLRAAAQAKKRSALFISYKSSQFALFNRRWALLSNALNFGRIYIRAIAPKVRQGPTLLPLRSSRIMRPFPLARTGVLGQTKHSRRFLIPCLQQWRQSLASTSPHTSQAYRPSISKNAAPDYVGSRT